MCVCIYIIYIINIIFIIISIINIYSNIYTSNINTHLCLYIYPWELLHFWKQWKKKTNTKLYTWYKLYTIYLIVFPNLPGKSTKSGVCAVDFPLTACVFSDISWVWSLVYQRYQRDTVLPRPHIEKEKQKQRRSFVTPHVLRAKWGIMNSEADIVTRAWVGGEGFTEVVWFDLSLKRKLDLSMFAVGGGHSG